jgi:hypothetical protein
MSHHDRLSFERFVQLLLDPSAVLPMQSSGIANAKLTITSFRKTNSTVVIHHALGIMEAF